MTNAAAAPNAGARPPDDRDRTIVRKVAWRLVPLLMACYFVAFLDRVNVGFAALTMNADLGFDGAVFGLGAGIFFVRYFIFEVPSAAATPGSSSRGLCRCGSVAIHTRTPERNWDH
jgi:hypothetical protein